MGALETHSGGDGGRGAAGAGELRNAEAGPGGEPRNVLVYSMIPEDYTARH